MSDFGTWLLRPYYFMLQTFGSAIIWDLADLVQIMLQTLVVLLFWDMSDLVQTILISAMYLVSVVFLLCGNVLSGICKITDGCDHIYLSFGMRSGWSMNVYGLWCIYGLYIWMRFWMIWWMRKGFDWWKYRLYMGCYVMDVEMGCFVMEVEMSWLCMDGEKAVFSTCLNGLGLFWPTK